MFSFVVALVVPLSNAVNPPNKIYAEPIGSNQLDNFHTVDNVALIINNSEDRVGARAKLCQSLSDTPCERIVFNFSELRLDKESNLIMLGDKRVAKLQRHGMRVIVDKNYRLGYEVVTNSFDSGFDKSHGQSLRVYLEAK